MSDSTTAVAAPVVHPSNIVGDPASTFAGVGLIASAVGQYMIATPAPTSTFGWAMFGTQLLGGILALLSRSNIAK